MPIANDVRLADDVRIFFAGVSESVRLHDWPRNDDWPFCRNSADEIVGARCKISPHTFICEGVTIEDEVFVGHGVLFTNDLFPRATTDDGRMQTSVDCQVIPTRVKYRAVLGSNATILAGVTIGTRTLVGA